MRARLPRRAVSTARRVLSIGAWWLLLAMLGAFVQLHLVVSSDLRSFMPPPRNADQRLLLDEIGEGPASQLLLIAIGGAPPPRLAAASRALSRQLRDDAHFARVLDGEVDPQRSIPHCCPIAICSRPRSTRKRSMRRTCAANSSNGWKISPRRVLRRWKNCCRATPRSKC